MLSRKAKTMFFLTMGPIMWINATLYRLIRAPRQGFVRVQLGPGRINYLHGWINVDANMFTAKCDVWADLRHRFPFHDNTVDAFYSLNVIEHLPDLTFHFREVYRCLKPGGVYRTGGPNGDSAITKFIAGDKRWFSDFPDNRTSIGGRLENFIFCRQEHLTILTFSFLEELMSDVGFIGIQALLPSKQTTSHALFGDCLCTEQEDESDWDAPSRLVVEAQK
jgi:SAM-dependent methyltransferase